MGNNDFKEKNELDMEGLEGVSGGAATYEAELIFQDIRNGLAKQVKPGTAACDSYIPKPGFTQTDPPKCQSCDNFTPIPGDRRYYCTACVDIV